MNEWVPIPPHARDLSAQQVEARLAGQLERLDVVMRARYNAYAVALQRAPKSWDEGRRTTPVWICAQAGDTVLAYDEVEDEYGIGRIGRLGIEDFGLYGEQLEWALRHFPAGGGQALGNAVPPA